MARINRKAFTLVEMLVVIVIISMLVAMLVPAVIGARENARRAQCMNRMDQLGKGVLQYESSKGYLPGYVNKIGDSKFSGVASSNNLSWVVAIFDNIGHADLWKEWRSSMGARTPVALPDTICPSDTERRGKTGALSYAANCGISDERSTDVGAYVALAPDVYTKPGCGLFFDHDPTVPNGLPSLPSGAKTIVKIGLDEIRDGAQQTIMLSENLNATVWHSLKIEGGTGTPVSQWDVGVLWWSAAAGLPWASDVPQEVVINSQTTNSKYRTRPSSNHPGGVNAIFGDGHSEFISDRVDYAVFRNQMVSNQTEVASAGLLVP